MPHQRHARTARVLRRHGLSAADRNWSHKMSLARELLCLSALDAAAGSTALQGRDIYLRGDSVWLLSPQRIRRTDGREFLVVQISTPSTRRRARSQGTHV